MQTIVFGLLAVLAFIAFLGVAHHFGAGPLLAAITNRGTQFAGRVWTELQIAYFGHAVPALKRLGWCIAGLMGLAFLGVLIHTVWGNGTWWLSALTFAAVAGFSAWIAWNVRRTHADFSLQGLLAAAFTGFLTLGIWLFVAAHIVHDRGVAVLGAAYVLMALEVLFLTVGIIVRLAAFGVYSTEGSMNLFTKLAVSLITNGKQGLKDVFGPGGVVIAEEEKWMPVVRQARRRVNNLAFPILALGIILVSPALTGFALIAGFARNLFWGYLEGNGIDTTTRRQRSALAFEMLCYVLLGAAALTVFIPGAGARVDVLWVTFGNLLIGALNATIDAITNGMGWLVGILLSAGAVYALWSKNPDAPLRRTRKFVAIPVTIILLFCAGGFIWTLIGNGVQNAAAKAGVSLAQEFIPEVKATTTPGVKVSWPNWKDADGYRVERRELHEAAFSNLKDLASGATAWEDTTVERGKTYFYRIVVASSKGTGFTSSEKQVTVPKEPEKKEPAKAAGTAKAPVAQSPCASGSCGRSPELSELCLRYPDACK